MAPAVEIHKYPDEYSFRIYNKGNAPATNLSIYVSGCGEYGYRGLCPYKIGSITNSFSTVDLVFPQYNYTSLEPGTSLKVNQSLALIQVERLVQGPASFINLLVGYVNKSGLPADPILTPVYAIYDQGSTSFISNIPHAGNLPDWLVLAINYGLNWYNQNVKPLLIFYIVFYGVLFAWVYLYYRARRTLKKFLTDLTDNIMEVRGALRNDDTNKNIISEVWFKIPATKRRRVIKDITHYVLIDDFFSVLRNRNLYISSSKETKESSLSRINTTSKLNEAVLAAAENVLNKVDWNKYR